MSEQSNETTEREAVTMRFVYRRGQVVGVRCSCGWSESGNGGATAHGMAWGAHANEAHPDAR